MGLQTPLFESHQRMGARIVPFGGWDMPLHYGSQVEEHHAVRRDSGMFDVSHMMVLDAAGNETREFLRYLLANDVDRLDAPGRALYSCMLNDAAGVLDDLIVYRRAEGEYRLVVNAATSEKDLAWMRARAAGFAVEIRPRPELGMIAIQGPAARAKVLPLLPPELGNRARALKPFHAAEAQGWFAARTGYTGEDGFEVILPGDQAAEFWDALAQSGVLPCGLGARDTLRLEAGMNLYGADMDETVSPLESGLGWTIAWQPEDRAFIGREKLEEQRQAGGLRRFVGLLLEVPGVLRSHQKLFSGERYVGETTSGGFSPTLERSIALARVAPGSGDRLQVEIRGRRLPVRVVKPPFARHGEPSIEL